MNRWLYRAVGAVGVASGALLLSNGVAHAQAANDATPDHDPQAMRGMVADFLTPLGQPREEFVGDLLGGGSPLGGLTGGLAGGDQDSGPTGLQDQLDSLADQLTGALTSGITGPDGSNPISGLTSLAGLGAGDGTNPLAALTSLTGLAKDIADGPLGTLTGGPLAGLTGDEGLARLTDTLTSKGDNNGPLAALSGDQGLARLTDTLTSKGDNNGPLAALTDNLTGDGDQLLDETLGPLNNLTDITDLAGTERQSIDRARLRDLVDGIGTIGSEGLASTALDGTARRPLQFNPDVARQLNDAMGFMNQAPIADAIAKRLGIAMEAATLPVEEDLPILGSLSALPGLGGPLKNLLGVGTFTNGVPVVSDVLNGKLDPGAVTKLPVVNQIVDRSIPFVGQALSSLSNQTTANGQTGMQRQAPAASQMGSHAPAAATVTGASWPGVTPSSGRPTTLPATVPSASGTHGDTSAPMPAPAGSSPTSRAAQSPAHVGRHRATDRPEVIDPELEAASALGTP